MTSIRPKAGGKAPEMKVVDSVGNVFNLSDKEGSDRNSLIVFYRGHW